MGQKVRVRAALPEQREQLRAGEPLGRVSGLGFLFVLHVEAEPHCGVIR
jgi:hypothetical protein